MTQTYEQRSPPSNYTLNLSCSHPNPEATLYSLTNISLNPVEKQPSHLTIDCIPIKEVKLGNSALVSTEDGFSDFDEGPSPTSPSSPLDLDTELSS